MGIKIAICDDEHQQTEYIKMLVSKWADENNIKINIDMFDSAENFKSAWNENKTFDVLLLDIEMNGQNGMELAREIRQSDSKLIIIFITGYIDTLIADESGKYYELWNAQAQYYSDTNNMNELVTA